MRARRLRSRPLARAGGAGLAIAFFSAAAPAAAGCAAPDDARSSEQRLAGASLAFIGRVRAVDADRVRFEVEHVLGGVAGRELVVAVPAGCAGFAVGDRWLYAGDASIRLGRGDDAGRDAIGRLRRSDDSALRLPPSWQACRADAECVPIAYGCSIPTAAAAPHREAAQEQAWRNGGDPRMMECARRPATEQPIRPLCVAGRCGSWSLQ